NCTSAHRNNGLTMIDPKWNPASQEQHRRDGHVGYQVRQEPASGLERRRIDGISDEVVSDIKSRGRPLQVHAGGTKRHELVVEICIVIQSLAENSPNDGKTSNRRKYPGFS
ncbi:MAG: hypothetical protein ACM3JD_05525, partial [Rudaea sp.]